MAKQIEIFSPEDPIIMDILQTCKIETILRYVKVTDNSTGETFKIYVNKDDEKALYDNPDKFMKEYLKNLYPTKIQIQ